MKPMIIIPPDVMSEDNLKLLRENGICVVVASDPAKVRFMDPIPAVSSRTQIENSAIKLSRILINGQWGQYNSSNVIGRETILKIFCDALVDGTPLDSRGSIEEREQSYFNQEKLYELQKLAREEARAERAAKKAAQQKPADKK